MGFELLKWGMTHKKILLAVDGSKSSKKAAVKTADFTAKLDAEVTIITVLDASTIELTELQSYRPEDSLEELMEKIKTN